MIEQKDITAIGKFQKTHALKGELNVILDVDSSFLSDGNTVIVELDGIFVPFYASGIRPKGNTSYLVKLNGIDSEEEARRFVNKIIYALKSELAPFLEVEEEDIADEDELIGYEIIDYDSNNMIGEIESIDSSTSNLLFIVASPSGATVYIPAAEEFVEEINDEEKKIYMRLPEGLIDLN